MDINQLIIDLQEISQKNSISHYKRDRCAYAATALSTLQAENEKLRADVVRLNDLLASYQNVLVPELRVELEQVKRENNALWTYIEIVDREYRRYMDRGYIDRLDELRRTWKYGQKED